MFSECCWFTLGLRYQSTIKVDNVRFSNISHRETCQICSQSPGGILLLADRRRILEADPPGLSLEHDSVRSCSVSQNAGSVPLYLTRSWTWCHRIPDWVNWDLDANVCIFCDWFWNLIKHKWAKAELWNWTQAQVNMSNSSPVSW